jgi:cytochrome c oxidase subunit II
MQSELPLFPGTASELAREVDLLYFAWAAISVFFTLLIAGLILYFMVKYRRRSPGEIGKPEHANVPLEIAWSVIPLAINLVMFGWGAKVFFDLYRPPADAIEYFAVGKQWMWKFQHPEGNREINELHVPVGQPVKLTMTSEDVIHSLFVPAFRTKADVMPGRYTSIWFRADRPGTYHLFCTEYCGAEHSQMIGSVVVLEPTAYEEWLSGVQPGQSTAVSGAQLFQSLACDTCHRPGADTGGAGAAGAGRIARAPSLDGLYGRQVALADGRQVLADETYIRESILNPMAKLVAGWEPVMPTFQGQVTEEQLVQLLAYVKSLGGAGTEGAQGGTRGTSGEDASGMQPHSTSELDVEGEP